MGRLLAEFPDVFQEPKGLPPSQACDHKITLMTSSEPPVLKPYCYLHKRKDEIKRQCAKMLEQVIIRPSHSPYSSPILVAQHDGTWRFCVDYRELNNRTIKNKFPILNVDKLLDEFHNAQYYAKFNFRSRYFQVKMASNNVKKTILRTHHGHFEFIEFNELGV